MAGRGLKTFKIHNYCTQHQIERSEIVHATHSVHVCFCMDLRTNNCYFPLQH